MSKQDEKRMAQALANDVARGGVRPEEAGFAAEALGQGFAAVFARLWYAVTERMEREGDPRAAQARQILDGLADNLAALRRVEGGGGADG